MNIPEFSVSEFSSAIKRTVEDAFGYVRIRGEISGFKKAASGHLYFSLKDESSILSAAFFRRAALGLDFDVEDGLEVIASGKITTYAGRSNYQIIVEKLEIAGIGAILEMIEKRRKKLLEEGLFDEKHKKQIPFFPKKIAIITSKTGAVIEDIKHRVSERCPTNLILYPVTVQGKNASLEIITAINYFDNLDEKPDVIIIARGGGSIEDLMPFNDESLVRAVFACNIPVISAVGHETDTTLIDYVSDLRAPTPSAAAELATPLLEDLKNNLVFFEEKIQFLTNSKFDEYLAKIADLQKYILDPRKLYENYLDSFRNLVSKFDLLLVSIFEKKQAMLLGLKISKNELLQNIDMKMQKITFLNQRIEERIINIFTSQNEKFLNLGKIFDNSNYDQILKRGFAIIKDKNNNLVSQVSDVEVNDHLEIQLSDGYVTSQIKDKKKNND